MKKRKMIFWLPCYPDVTYSFIVELARRAHNDVAVVCLSGLPTERGGIYSQDALESFCKVIECIGDIGSNPLVEKMIRENEDSIHIFGGFLGRVGEVLEYYNNHGCKRAVIITEKPSILPAKHFNGLIRILKKIRSRMMYSNQYKKVANAVAAVCVTGEKGVCQLESYGIPKEKLFKFMYTHIEETVTAPKRKTGAEIRFVYVGRFDLLRRGLDFLMYAFDSLKSTNWHLDLVGGYGENKDEIISWAESNDRVSFIGSWKNDEVINRLRDYDVCISPTKVDGWRIQVNQAIMAGIGTITTNEAISDELVTASQSGLVVDAFDRRKLKLAIESLLANPEQIDEWKKNAEDFAPKITNCAFADYFESVLEFVFCSERGKERPECLW